MKPMRVVTNTTGQPYPSRQSYVYASLWDASKLPDPTWAGKRTPETYSDANWALEGAYKNMKVVTPILE